METEDNIEDAFSEDEYQADEVRHSNVLLGFAEVLISEEETPVIEDTFIGGKPLWLHPESPPSPDLLVCKNCNSPLRLFLQTNSPLAHTLYDRIIYIFGCNKPQCRRKKGSVRAIRSLRKDPETMKRREIEDKKAANKLKLEQEKLEAKREKNRKLTQDLFGASSKDSGSNPFGSNPFASSDNSFTEPEKEKTNEEAEIIASEYLSEVPSASHLRAALKKLEVKLPSFPGYILDIDDEFLNPGQQVLEPLPNDITLKEALDSEGRETGILTKMPEKINNADAEEMMKSLDDVAFRHFTEIISFNTKQVLRYDIGGVPLLYSTKDDVSKAFYDERGKLRKPELFNIPTPGYHPNGSRRFELQLMPQAIIDFESDGSIDILKDGMEWGTILVATDSDDFIPDAYFDENYVAYVEEWCGVQWEEEVKF
ncbi:DEKNAAC104603 [Brettanomyces naardenensis]|uniref:DEKNAAC104603 n=1 Tax=Brettanomyces naardenensis TaxID=13370 RepID=A0A448YR13_BRENA|nr:DEKNAAC104603 [Brettanomyces naardenensis]